MNTSISTSKNLRPVPASPNFHSDSGAGSPIPSAISAGNEFPHPSAPQNHNRANDRSSISRVGVDEKRLDSLETDNHARAGEHCAEVGQNPVQSVLRRSPVHHQPADGYEQRAGDHHGQSELWLPWPAIRNVTLLERDVDAVLEACAGLRAEEET
ncbi:hypothetical protein Cob_v009845 [Colletotrichum orbiculare MAFF 240422]|uniref:Uncharacterized protein n=1 Tax=Colletotrichum orbiculare (strain 104-T / ATCC 96160 / CBS 514.97 / LARS 414 / MAFF 240422) TaxID=1213857 RepID=A0A484FFY5_COLOR|nr:hypothetical protein Cob_v009845 [Colletotrichum orbiculare MAFF 240422]